MTRPKPLVADERGVLAALDPATLVDAMAPAFAAPTSAAPQRHGLPVPGYVKFVRFGVPTENRLVVEEAA